MLFNSLEFAVFLPLVFAVYWLIGPRRIHIQNLFILLSSYVFYGWWNYEFLLLIVISSATDFVVGQKIEKSAHKKKRKFWLGISLAVNLGVLVYFKYANFFIDNFIESFRFLGYSMQADRLNIILPVGISFYTFQTLSYSIDVYKNKISASNNWVQFFAYVSFFPQLVAGPIERARSLLPQFKRAREFTFSKGRSGLRQILWGLFKKVVIADNCAQLADEIFANYPEQDSTALLLGAFYFTFQIYGDFSGYSDIAIGTARLFGFNLMTNFRYPYFSRDIAEFWRRWHISLSSWFKDYVYIPLGGSRGTFWQNIRNVMIIFLVSGFWHGANWTFIFWGFLNAIYFLPLFVSGKNRQNLIINPNKSIREKTFDILKILRTFLLTMLAWIFFRAPNIQDAVNYIYGILQLDLVQPELRLMKFLPLVALLVVWEWIMKQKPHGLAFTSIKRPLRWGIYLSLIWLIAYYFGDEQDFIYFQF